MACFVAVRSADASRAADFWADSLSGKILDLATCSDRSPLCADPRPRWRLNRDKIGNADGSSCRMAAAPNFLQRNVISAVGVDRLTRGTRPTLSVRVNNQI